MKLKLLPEGRPVIVEARALLPQVAHRLPWMFAKFANQAALMTCACLNGTRTEDLQVHLCLGIQGLFEVFPVRVTASVNVDLIDRLTIQAGHVYFLQAPDTSDGTNGMGCSGVRRPEE